MAVSQIPTVSVRPCTASDTAALAAVYRESVHALGPLAYNASQVKAWARFADNLSALRDQLLAGVTLVVEWRNNPIAFGQLHPTDHIALLYTSPAHTRQGHAGRICAELEKFARGAGMNFLNTNASRIARPFFERNGFTVAEVEHPIRYGVRFERFKMEKRLT